MKNINEDIIKEIIKKRVNTPDDLSSVKRKMAKRYVLPCSSNIELLESYRKLVKNKKIKKSLKIEILLRVRPVRSLSGIVNVSVLTKPYPCPGKCIYCPDIKGIPKSYLDKEPAVMRAILNNYHPSKQVSMRLRSLRKTGHPIDKVELRVIGGTWSFYQKRYQTWFIKECFRACNEFERKLKNNNQSLKHQQKINEKAISRIVGLSIETRPDFIDRKEIIRMRKMGITRVELGVQTIYNDILKMNKRGHDIEETKRATKLLKDAGFKICYQMMPNLFGSDLKKDEKMFKELFSNPDFQPDLLKIYPTAIIKGTLLYKYWKNGKYSPYSKKQLISLVKKIKKIIPYYVRIQRITRDIPSSKIVAGPAKISNLRQIIAQDMQKEGWKCKCIRCREAGRNYSKKENNNKSFLKKELKMFRQEYDASGGKEIFLSFEDKEREVLYSLLRLRIPSNDKNMIPSLRNSALIREIHTYSQLVPIEKNKSSLISAQHKGLGKRLIKEAEKIIKKEFSIHSVKSIEGSTKKSQFNRVKKIAVISGVGVRKYYQKLGYSLQDTYMVKNICN
jgi:elongator complex protein 3